ncbi:MAG: lysophospholipid acyltransferase family protein [Cyclobacteriaceae bacterium]
MIKNLLGNVFYLWTVFVFTALMLIVVPFMVIPVLINPKFSYISYGVIKIWTTLFCWLTGIRYRVHGKEHIRPKTAYIFISNHGSFLDIPGFALTIPGEFRPLAKKELLKIPVFNWILKALTIIVDRTNQSSREESTRRLAKSIQRKIPIYIAPEGTRNDTNEPLLPFYDGAFRIAIEAQAPVLPFVIINADKLMPKNRFWAQPGRIDIYALEPISTKGLTRADIKSLNGHTYQLMEQVILQRQRKKSNQVQATVSHG